MVVRYEYANYTKKPLDSASLLRYLVSKGIIPLAVRVDNNTWIITVEWTNPLKESEKEKLDRAITHYLASIAGGKE